MDIKTTYVDTFTATIYVGFKDTETGSLVEQKVAEQTIQDYCNRVGLCVTVTPTKFIYVNGFEEGIAVGFINYPRFPSTIENIVDKATALAIDLLAACNQINISIVFPNRTVMLTNIKKKEDVAAKRVPGYTS